MDEGIRNAFKYCIMHTANLMCTGKWVFLIALSTVTVCPSFL
jgi:hypothetical protein